VLGPRGAASRRVATPITANAAKLPTLGAGYSEERIASPSILMADITSLRLAAASVL
jgi:hypothetical protein